MLDDVIEWFGAIVLLIASLVLQGVALAIPIWVALKLIGVI